MDARGKTWRLETAVAKGDAWAQPDAQMTDRELADKFRENGAGRIPDGQIEGTIELVLGRLLETDDVSILGPLGAGPIPS